jgi:hypothetical protein
LFCACEHLKWPPLAGHLQTWQQPRRVNHETLRNWVNAQRRERRDGPAPLGGEERAELARLRRRVAELELEKEILRKPRSSSPGTDR